MAPGRQADGGLQADTGMGQAVDDRVERFQAVACLLCCGGLGEADEVFVPPGLGTVADHGQRETACRSPPCRVAVLRPGRDLSHSVAALPGACRLP
jgi:hypothetical protein